MSASRLLPLLLFVLGLAACGTVGSQPPPQSPSRDGAAFIRQQLGELRRLDTPAGVAPQLWRSLVDSLAQELQARLDSGRTALAAPSSSQSQTTLSLDAVNQRLSWRYNNQGDYDQNSEVNGADLVPIAQHYQATSGGGSFPPDDPNSAVDGDNNGEINIADITPIAQNFGRRLLSYTIYSSSDAADFPTSSTGPNGAGAQLLGTLELADATGDPKLQRLSFGFDSGPIGATTLFWVRPNDAAAGAGQDGTPSNSAGPGAITLVSVSGTVETDANVALPGVTLTLTGVVNGPFQAVTDASGSFSFSGIPSDAYTLGPELTDCTFAPAQRLLPAGGVSFTGQDFTASLQINETPYGFRVDFGGGDTAVAHFDKGTVIDIYVEPGVGVPGWQASFDQAFKEAMLHWNAVGVPWGLFEIRSTNDPAEAEMSVRWVQSLGGATIGRANLAVTSPPPRITLPMDIEMATGNVSGPATDEIVRMVTVHELGHALGLWEHSNLNTDIMFPSVSTFELPSKRDLWTMYTLYNTAADYTAGERGTSSAGGSAKSVWVE